MPQSFKAVLASFLAPLAYLAALGVRVVVSVALIAFVVAFTVAVTVANALCLRTLRTA